MITISSLGYGSKNHPAIDVDFSLIATNENSDECKKESF